MKIFPCVFFVPCSEQGSRQVARRLDKGVVSKHSLKTEGGRQLATFVNEDGLYDVILEQARPKVNGK